MRTAAVPSFHRLRPWPRRATRNCPTSTFRNPVWKIFFYITPEGACAIELENVWRNAGARRPCGAAKCDSTAHANLPAAAAIRLHLRQGDGGQWLYASSLQEPAAPRHHRDQHGLYRSLGGGHAAHRRISMDARNRRPLARSHRQYLDRDRKSHRRNAAGAGGWAGSVASCMARARTRSSDQCRHTTHLRSDPRVGRGVFRVRRPCPGMQYGPTTYWSDVQHGHDAHDFLWLHLLSMERLEGFSHPAEGCVS